MGVGSNGEPKVATLFACDTEVFNNLVDDKVIRKRMPSICRDSSQRRKTLALSYFVDKDSH
ncbi:hypothetical protein SAMN02799630_00137 [Paenibacillus sp. UNCCL117]|nr:hypothetical protein SAMN04488602_102395 [Paenibacillus sp. cl123]SFW11477.1 hypothetical protein SAMN02799630_00137 [Paenibacillus sp. UNCCL117]